MKKKKKKKWEKSWTKTRIWKKKQQILGESWNKKRRSQDAQKEKKIQVRLKSFVSKALKKSSVPL